MNQKVLPTNLIYLGEGKWLRFANSVDSDYLLEGIGYAVIYNSGRLLRVMERMSAIDFVLNCDPNDEERLESIATIIKNQGVNGAVIYSDDPLLIDAINGRTPSEEEGSEKSSGIASFLTGELKYNVVGEYAKSWKPGTMRQMQEVIDAASAKESFLVHCKVWGLGFSVFKRKGDE